MMTILQKLFRYLITGTVFLLPFIITASIVAWIGINIAKYFGPNTLIGSWLEKIGFFWLQSNYPLLSWFLGLLTTLLVLIIIGFLVERRFVKQAVNAMNGQIKRIPAIGTLYGSIHQLVSLFVKNENSDMKNMKPVYCRFGGTIVLALMPTTDKFIIGDKSFYSVIIPTAPIPFGGAVLMVPEEDVIFSDMHMDQFLSYYGSMGATGNQYIPTSQNNNQTFADGNNIN